MGQSLPAAPSNLEGSCGIQFASFPQEPGQQVRTLAV